MNPLISIIIPSYNQGHFISETIESILSQSYQNFEILVIDGGSNDGTIEILKKFGDKIFWLSEKDKGQTHAINKGLRLAKGEIITYINSDDYFLENVFQIIVNCYNHKQKLFWITGDYIIINENGKYIQNFVRLYKKIFRNFISFNLLTILNPIIQPSTFISKNLFEKVGFFNESLDYTMDYDYWLRCFKICTPIVLTNKLSAFRIHKYSKGGSRYKYQFDEELEVAKIYQDNNLFIIIHLIHNQLIKIAYWFIK